MPPTLRNLREGWGTPQSGDSNEIKTLKWATLRELSFTTTAHQCEAPAGDLFQPGFGFSSTSKCVDASSESQLAREAHSCRIP
jgi:hypothetical protein